MVINQNCLPVSYQHGDYSQPVGFIPPCFADIVPNSCFVPLNLMCLAVQAEKDISGQLSEGKWGESFSIKLASSASGFQASAHRCKDVTWCNTVPKKLRFKASNCLTVWHLYASKIRHKRHCGIALFFWSKPALCQVPTSFPTVLIWVQTRESPLFPVLLPSNKARNALPNDSRPSNTVSRVFTFPSPIHWAMSCKKCPPLTKEPWQTLKALYGLLCVDHVGDIDLVWRHFCFIVIRNDPTNSYSSFWAQALHCSFKVHTSHILKIHIYPSRCCLSQGLQPNLLLSYRPCSLHNHQSQIAPLQACTSLDLQQSQFTVQPKTFFAIIPTIEPTAPGCTTDPESFTFLWLQNIDQSPICSRSRHSKERLCQD